MTTHVDNILSTYRAATPAHHDDGMAWYHEAHLVAHEIGNGDVWRGAGVIAAFSPLTPWWRNMELAIDSLRTGHARTDTLGNSSRAAQRIIDGEFALDVLMGDKTRAFCENIARDGISDAVTVDVHAYSIAMGERIPSSRVKLGKRLYVDIASAYCEVAYGLDLMPTQLQAITWLVWRDRYRHNAARKGE